MSKKIIKKNNTKTKTLTISKDSYKPIVIGKWIFFITPLVFFLYLYMISIKDHKDFYSLIGSSPLITVTFIEAMLGFFCGWVCRESIKNLETSKHISITKIYLIIIAICQLFLGNIIGSALLWIGIFKLRKFKGTKLNTKNILEELKNTLLIFLACLFIILISVLCLMFLSLVCL